MAIRGMLCALAVAAAMPASAAEQTFSGEYRISYLGLTIARTTFNRASMPAPTKSRAR